MVANSVSLNNAGIILYYGSDSKTYGIADSHVIDITVDLQNRDDINFKALSSSN